MYLRFGKAEQVKIQKALKKINQLNQPNMKILEIAADTKQRTTQEVTLLCKRCSPFPQANNPIGNH